MFKLVLEKAEEPEIKLTTSAGSWKRQESSRKTSISALLLATNPNGASLSGATTLPAAAGVTTFAGLSLNKTGTGYRLAAGGAGLAADTSPPFDVTPGTAGQLAILTGPSAGAQSGVAFAQQPTVQLQDQNGNPVSQGGITITATVATGPSGATVFGATASTDASGLATFAGLGLSGPVAVYTLNFTATGLTPAVSGPITLSAGAAAKLGITTQPPAIAQSGIVFSQQPDIQVQDAAGNAVPQSGVAVTATITSGGGTLGGTLTVTTDAQGVASFTDLSISGTVGPRALAFDAPGLGGAISSTIQLQAGVPAQIALNAGDGQSATAGTAVPVSPSVVVRDSSGNPVAGVPVTFTVASGGGTVSPASPVTTDASGIAAATSWTLGPTAGPNQLTAAASGLQGSPVVFNATATVCSTTAIAKSSV